MSQNPFSKTSAGTLVQLAEIASQAGLSETTLLPNGWSLLRLVTSDKSQTATPNPQGFYASGTLDDSGQRVCVLAIGVTWASFLDNYYADGKPMLWDKPPDDLVGSGAGSAMIATNSGTGFARMYVQIRKSIWSNLSTAGSLPLYVVGKCLAGPLAQMAALDLRAGHVWPTKDATWPASTATPTCYVFSAPPFASPDFASYFNKQVPQCYNVRAGDDTLPVDLFPSRPTKPINLNLGEFTDCGQPQPLRTTRPTPDDNWVERSGNFYLSALGGTPQPPPPFPGRIVNPPTDFSRDLAYTLAQLSAYALVRRQRPDATIDIRIAPYQFQGDLAVNGIRYCSLFTSPGNPGSVAAAFTDTVTWEELANVQACSFAQNANFIPGTYSRVHLGLLNIYTGQVGAKTFREALIAQLQALTVGGKTLYLTGHGFGGALAGLAALDLRSNYRSTVLSKLYTFGAAPFATFPDVVEKFNAALGADAFLVARPSDFMPKLKLTMQYFPLNNAVRLEGVPANDEPTGHAITGYLNLLNTSPLMRESAAFDSTFTEIVGVGEYPPSEKEDPACS